MNSVELKRYMTIDQCIDSFEICSADQLPERIVHRPCYYIVNTAKVGKRGKHCNWVTFYFPFKGPNEFFDSEGKTPDFYSQDFVTSLEENYLFNTIPLQGGSPACGHYCLYYVTHRCRGITMYRIVEQLVGIRERDTYVMEYVKQFF